MPAHDEQRVRNSHYARITCNGYGCPGSVRDMDGAERYIRAHAPANRAVPGPIPRRAATAVSKGIALLQEWN